MKKIIPCTLLFLFIFVLIKNRVQPSAASQNTEVPQEISIITLPPGTYKVIRNVSRTQEQGSPDTSRVVVEVETTSDSSKRITKIYWIQPSQMHNDFQIGNVFRKKPGDAYSTHQHIP